MVNILSGLLKCNTEKEIKIYLFVFDIKLVFVHRSLAVVNSESLHLSYHRYLKKKNTRLHHTSYMGEYQGFCVISLEVFANSCY